MSIETAAELCLVLRELGHEVELMWHPAGVGGPDAGSHHRQTSRTTRPRPGSVTHLHREGPESRTSTSAIRTWS
jgi:hypothetical protein